MIGSVRRILPSGLLLWACTMAGAPATAEPIQLDRAVVRFTAPETGGTAAPRFVFERVLAFQARLEALAEPGRRIQQTAGYRERHVRAALERTIAETLLASLRIDPEPTRAELTRQARAVRLVLMQSVGGPAALQAAARAEGIGEREILRILRRRARASLYLDRMVAPMLRPSDAELRSIHRTAKTPFRGRPFDEVVAEMRRWYVSKRLSVALDAFYQNARSRIQVMLL